MVFKILFTGSAAGPPFGGFSQVKDFPGRLPPLVWGAFFFVLCDTWAHHGAFGFRRNDLQKCRSYQFCLRNSHQLHRLVSEGNWEKSSFHARLRKLWKNTLLLGKLISENDEC